MNVKAVLIDFDGTVVTKDLLDVVCGIVGKEEESRKLNEDFYAGRKDGLVTLIERINLLNGVSTDQIYTRLSKNDYLMQGAKEFFNYLSQEGIVSILQSGNLVPILQYYQKKLGISYVVGTSPRMERNRIVSIGREDFSGRNFKLVGSQQILKRLGIPAEKTVAIGDSPADKIIFEFAARSIAINPKGGIEQFANYVIYDNLYEAARIIKKLSENLI